MTRRCGICKHFKYIESNVYGRCQYGTVDSALEGIPRVPWATACEFYQDRRSQDKTNSNEDREVSQKTAEKQTPTHNDLTACRRTDVKTNCIKPQIEFAKHEALQRNLCHGPIESISKNKELQKLCCHRSSSG